MEDKKEKEGAAPTRVLGQQGTVARHWFSSFRFHHPLMKTCGLSLPRQTYLSTYTKQFAHGALSDTPAQSNLSVDPEVRTPELRGGSAPVGMY